MITRPITRPVTSPIARGINAAFSAWNPRALFALGEQGIHYDPNDLSTLWQNAAGTIPVTAAGQPVGRMLDKSGRGNHISFGDGAGRPMLRFNIGAGYYYLEPDGADDFGVTASIDFTGTDKVSVFAGVRKLNDATSMFVELSADINASNGAFTVVTGGGVGEKFRLFSKGTIPAGATTNSAAYAAPVSVALSCSASISGDLVALRLNGAQVAIGASDQGSGNYGNYPLYLFRRGGTSLPWAGHFYGLIIVGRLCTAAETSNIERLLAQRTGVALA